jgi:hypothetical protein
MTTARPKAPPFTYHCVPGERSRVAEVVRAHFAGVFRPWEQDQGLAADFVWAHTRGGHNDGVCAGAAVCSMLSFAEVLESKANLALLRPRLRHPSLESHVVRGVAHLRAWCAGQYGIGNGGGIGSGGSGVWALKDSASNGGDGLWCVHRRSWRVVVAQVAAFEAELRRRAEALEAGAAVGAERRGEKPLEPREAARLYVLQRWVENPLLWQPSEGADGVLSEGLSEGPSERRNAQGRKFHLRVYHVLLASGQAFSYRHAFAHVANRPWVPHSSSGGGGGGGSGSSSSSSSSSSSGGAGVGAGAEALFDRQIHLTNVSCNSTQDEAAFAGFLGVDVPARFPEQWRIIQRSLADVAAAAAPFLAAQAGAAHFAHIGGDWLLDDAGGAWLLELNVPPCMFAYDGQDDGSGGIGVHPHETAVAPAMRRSTHALIEAFVLPVLRGDAAVFVRAREGDELHGWTAANGAPPAGAALPRAPVAHAEELALNELAWTAYQMKLVSGCSGGQVAPVLSHGFKQGAATNKRSAEEEEEEGAAGTAAGAPRQRTIRFVAAAVCVAE